VKTINKKNTNYSRNNQVLTYFPRIDSFPTTISCNVLITSIDLLEPVADGFDYLLRFLLQDSSSITIQAIVTDAIVPAILRIPAQIAYKLKTKYTDKSMETLHMKFHNKMADCVIEFANPQALPVIKRIFVDENY